MSVHHPHPVSRPPPPGRESTSRPAIVPEPRSQAAGREDRSTVRLTTALVLASIGGCLLFVLVFGVVDVVTRRAHVSDWIALALVAAVQAALYAAAFRLLAGRR